MSRGSIFQLITQDDYTDKYFTAIDLLTCRLKAIGKNRVPTMKDIEQTHILYIKSNYTPYVSVVSDYVKTSSCSNSTNKLGQSEGVVEFAIPNFGHFTSDIAVHVRFDPLGNKTAYLNNDEPTTQTPLYKYCAYPGIRLFKKVELLSDNILVDRYEPDDVLAYKNFFVGSNHKPGWDKCYGQNEIQQATYNNRNFIGYLNYSNGAQTPKLYQEGFDMFIPLKFWFCEDISQALLNDSTPQTQRKIRITLAPITDIIQTLVYSVENNDPPPNITQLGTQIVPLPIQYHNMSLTLYANNIYTYACIYDIINNENVFNLIRVHKNHIASLNSASDNILLNQLNYPCEYLSIGFRNKNNKRDFDRWHLMGSDYINPDPNNINAMYVPNIIWNNNLNIRQLISHQVIKFTSYNNIIENIGLTVYGGITIYPTLPHNFYNDYMPVRYHKYSSVISPYDNNIFLLTFCLYPGKFEPSGYFNLSTSREIYLNYTFKDEYSDMVSQSYEMVTCMSALNFLIRDKNSLRLKYTM